jgi:hypothetical protein
MWASSWEMTPAISFAREHVKQLGRECIRLRVVHKIEARHWQPFAIGQLRHDVEKIRRRVLVDLLGAVHRQHEPIGVPVGQEIHRGSDATPSAAFLALQV